MISDQSLLLSTNVLNDIIKIYLSSIYIFGDSDLVTLNIPCTQYWYMDQNTCLGHTYQLQSTMNTSCNATPNNFHKVYSDTGIVVNTATR